MRRREVLALIGSAGVTAAPLAAWAEGESKVYRVGLLSGGPPIADKSPFGLALARGLARYGFVVDRNLAFERLGALGHADRLARLVAELRARKVDVIVTQGYPAAFAATRGSGQPVVALNSGDPVATGLVRSLAQPGGEITGISDVSAELAPKRLQLLKEFVPGLRRVAILWNADDLGMTLRYRAVEDAAKVLGVDIQPLGVREPDDFAEAFAAMRRQMPDGVLMVTDSLTVLNHKRVFEFTAARRLPAIYEFAFLVRDGGLMSYGPDDDESYGRVAALVGRVLRGAKPAELPFEEPTRFRLALNARAARSLGVKVPAALLARADEVVE